MKGSRAVRRIAVVVGAVLVLFASSRDIRGAAVQERATPPEVVETVSEEAASGAAAASDPLPAPSFRRAYIHVFLAFAVAWALLLGYMVLMNRRLAGAERDLRRLAARER